MYYTISANSYIIHTLLACALPILISLNGYIYDCVRNFKYKIIDIQLKIIEVNEKYI